MPQDVLERRRVVLGVEPHLALVDDAFLVLMQDLDGVLDGDDVLAHMLVDVIDHGGERGGLPGTGGVR